MRTAAVLATFGILGAGLFARGANGEKRLFGIILPPQASSAAEAPIDPATLKLVAALGSESYREREKAGQLLEAQGEKVLPDLRRAMNATESPEVSRRLAVIVRRMDHDRLVAPKRITLSMKGKTAKAAFDEIAKQTGYKIQFDGGGGFNPGPGGAGEAKHDFQFDQTPFWVAMDKIAEKAGLNVNSDYGDDLVHVNSYSDSHNPHVSYAGPFRFVATGINSNRNVQLSGISRRGFQNRTSENIGLSFQVYSEPKNPILGTLPVEVITAVDDLGGNLVAPKDPNNVRYSNYYQNSYRGHNAYGNLNLLRGAKEATTIKTLKAKMGIILLAGVLPEIVIADPLKAKNKTVAGRTAEMSFDSLTEANGQYTAVITVKKLNQDPNNIDYNWSNSVWQKVELVDAAGKKYFTYGPNAINNNGQSVQLTIPFNTNNRQGVQEKLGKPVKLILNEWLQVTNEVTFEFTGVPLP
jgi:hypothetical protein